MIQLLTIHEPVINKDNVTLLICFVDTITYSLEQIGQSLRNIKSSLKCNSHLKGAFKYLTEMKQVTKKPKESHLFTFGRIKSPEF